MRRVSSVARPYEDFINRYLEPMTSDGERSGDWERLGRVDPRAIERARTPIRSAMQLIDALGRERADPHDAWHHVAASWSPERRALIGARARAGYRLGLSIARRRFLVIGEGGEATGISFAGRTLAEARADVAARLAALDPAGAPSLVRQAGAAQEAAGDSESGDRSPDEIEFEAPDEVDAELERWLSNADSTIRAATGAYAGAAPVLCWPHHFDIASLVVLDPDVDPEEARSINVGLSTGDGAYPEPYWYVTPWPRPPEGRLPGLDAGRWHTKGFCAAVLPGSMMPLSEDARAQSDAAAEFLAAAVDVCHDLLQP